MDMGAKILARKNGARLELHTKSSLPLSPVIEAMLAVERALEQEKRDAILAQQKVFDETCATIRKLARATGQPTQAHLALREN